MLIVPHELPARLQFLQEILPPLLQGISLDAQRISSYIRMVGLVRNKEKGFWKEAAVAYFGVLTRNFYGGTEEGHIEKSE
jgi:hypothetical protein